MYIGQKINTIYLLLVTGNNMQKSHQRHDLYSIQTHKHNYIMYISTCIGQRINAKFSIGEFTNTESYISNNIIQLKSLKKTVLQ